MKQYKKLRQLSVFLENRAGELEKVLDSLAAEAIDLRAISLADTSDFGILRLLTSDSEKTEHILRERGFTLGYTPVVAVTMQDKPGALAEIVALISSQNINVEYMYSQSGGDQGTATMIFRFDKADDAIKIFRQKGFVPADAN